MSAIFDDPEQPTCPAKVPTIANCPAADSQQIAKGALRRTGSTMRAMLIGQHILVVLLSGVGAVRAAISGVAPAAVIITALALIAWHLVGTLRNPSARFAKWWLLGFAGVWLLAIAVSAEFAWLAFLLWLLAGHVLPLRWGIPFAAIVLGVVLSAPAWQQGTFNYSGMLGPMIGCVFTFAISRGYLRLLQDAAERENLLASLTAAHAQMAALQAELLLAERRSGAIAERTRISRDIHDTIAQALSSIRLLAHAGAESKSATQSQRALTQVAQLAGDSLADVRRIVAALAPSELEQSPLAQALAGVRQRFCEQAQLQCHLRIGTLPDSLSTDYETAFLRTAQSALANVQLHAQAQTVTIDLAVVDHEVCLVIADDGVGFNVRDWQRVTAPLSAAAPPDANSSFGLRFMGERLRELGGELDVVSIPGEGTTISARLPLNVAATHKENK